jgi:AcrR family transcriptional regulator
MSAADRILDVAERLFYQQGYTGTGVNQIIAEAETAKASFYQHFASKEALAEAYLQRRHDRWFEQLEAWVNPRQTPRRRLLAAFDFLADWLAANEYRGCAFLNLQSERQLPQRLTKQICEHKSELRAFFRREAGPLSRQPAKLGDELLLLFEGSLVEAQVYGDGWPVTAARKAARHKLDHI